MFVRQAITGRAQQPSSLTSSPTKPSFVTMSFEKVFHSPHCWVNYVTTSHYIRQGVCHYPGPPTVLMAVESKRAGLQVWPPFSPSPQSRSSHPGSVWKFFLLQSGLSGACPLNPASKMGDTLALFEKGYLEWISFSLSLLLHLCSFWDRDSSSWSCPQYAVEDGLELLVRLPLPLLCLTHRRVPPHVAHDNFLIMNYS